MISNEEVTQTILEVLGKLEYRGYDSWGIAIINSETKNIACNKTEGKLKNLNLSLLEMDV